MNGNLMNAHGGRAEMSMPPAIQRKATKIERNFFVALREKPVDVETHK